MAELYRGVYLGPIAERLGTSDLREGPALTDLVQSRMRYPLGRHWTPDLSVARAFALAERGGSGPSWRQQQWDSSPLLGLIFTIDSTFIDNELLEAAVEAGLEAASNSQRYRGFDFFNEKEYRLPTGWCPDIDIVHAELITSDGQVLIISDLVRPVIKQRREVYEDRIALNEEAKWVELELIEMEEDELARFFPRTDPRLYTATGRAAMAQEIADDPDWSSEVDWLNADLDDPRPGYWDPDDPETW